MELAVLVERLTQLEDREAIRLCIAEYMQLCDTLNTETPLDRLVGLFTPDAIWEGVGERYRKGLGVYQGRGAIYKMFNAYITGKTHFIMNAHFLTSEKIIFVDANHAKGEWLMLQASTFQGGSSHLNSARLVIEFTKTASVEECGGDEESSLFGWQISHFTTCNIFSRPIDYWDHEADLPVPDFE